MKNTLKLILFGMMSFLFSVEGISQDENSKEKTSPDQTARVRYHKGLVGTEVNVFSRVPPPALYTSRTGLQKAATANISVTSWGSVPTAARPAVQKAIDIWSHLITTTVPISIDLVWKAYPEKDPTLAEAVAISAPANFYGARKANMQYPIALAEMLSQSNLNVNNAEIHFDINGNKPWYCGTDGITPRDQYDLVTVVLHELTHGLGMDGDGWWSWDNQAGSPKCGYFNKGEYIYPYIYDYYLVNSQGQLVTSLNLLEIGSAMVSDALFFDADKANAANSGSRVKLYAPTTWAPGSSIYHLDPTIFPIGSPNSLMGPELSKASSNHSPGPIVLGMFQDMGWIGAGHTASVTAPTANSQRTQGTNLSLTWTDTYVSSVYVELYQRNLFGDFVWYAHLGNMNSSVGNNTFSWQIPTNTPDGIYRFQVEDPFQLGLAYGASEPFYITTSLPIVATPRFSPAPDTYPTTQTVTLSTTTAGATIWYTVDGTDPYKSSTRSSCSSGFNIPVGPNDTWLRAEAEKDQMLPSAIAEGKYYIGPHIPAPEPYPPSGDVTIGTLVSVTQTPGLTCGSTSCLSWNEKCDGKPVDPNRDNFNPWTSYVGLNYPGTATFKFINYSSRDDKFSEIVTRTYNVIPGIRVAQLDKNLVSFGSWSLWQGSRWSSYPDISLVPPKSTATWPLLAQQDFKSGSNQKYHLWEKGSRTYLVNHANVEVTSSDAQIFAKFLPAGTATINVSLEGTGVAGTIRFIDPWLIDFTDEFNTPTNRGLSAIPKERTSPFNLDFVTPYGGDLYRGVFLNENPTFDPQKPLYFIQAPSTQSISVNRSNITSNFQSWTYDPNFVNLRQVGSNPSGYDQKAVVFRQAGATITANYKGTHLSSVSTAFANNGARKFVRTANGYLHLVYESVGHVWYEQSTDGGITWTIANNGTPLDSYGAKLPAIDCQANDVAIVWEENFYGGGGAALKMARFVEGSIGMNWGYPLLAYADACTPYTQNLNPAIAYDYQEKAVIAWENKANCNYPIGIVVMHGPLGRFPGSPYGNWSTDYATAISSSDANCTNPTIAAAKTPSDQINMKYHIAWQYTQSSQYSYVKYCILTANSGGVTMTGVSTPSDGAGFWQNRRPSIAVMNDNIVRLAWDGYTPWYGNRAIYRPTDSNGNWSSTIINMGSNVVQSSANTTGDGNFVIGWVQNYPSFTNNFVKSDNLYAIKNFNTTGANLQINNAASFASMYGMAFQNQTLPYSFAMSSYVGGIPKETIHAVSSGRGVVATAAGKQFCVGVADISVNGNAVKFVALPASAYRRSKDTLSRFLRSEDFQITNAAKATLTLFHGMVNPCDSTNIVDSTGGIGQIVFQVLLVNAVDGNQITELGRYAVVAKQKFSTDATSYTLSLAGSTPAKRVRIEIHLLGQGRPEYTINEFFSTDKAISLAKSESQQLLLTIPSEKVTTYALAQNYPNPFNPTTKIDYQIPKDGQVTITVFDELGREVVRVVDQYQVSGRYSAEFDGRNFSSGIYYYSIHSGDYRQVRKMILMK